MTFPDISARLGSIRDYCSAAEQSAKTVFLKLKTFRSDPEFFQKVCQVAFAVIELIIMQSPSAASLSRLSAVLKTANMHDFYLFLKFPSQVLLPWTSHEIDDNAVLDSLDDLFFNKYKKYTTENTREVPSFDELTNVQKLLVKPSLEEISEGSESSEESESSESSEDIVLDMRNLARACLKKQLELMDQNNYSFSSEKAFKDNFQVQLNSESFKAIIRLSFLEAFEDMYRVVPTAAEKEELSLLTVAIASTDLKDLKVPLRHVPLLEKITNWNWNLVDVGCILTYCKEWRFIDTVKLADNIGQFKVLQWVKGQTLDTWVVGLVSAGFALKLVEAVRKLRDDKLTPEQRTIAKWNVATSSAELIFYGAIYLNCVGKTAFELASLQWLAIFSKSLGLLMIAVRPKHEFFQIPVAASAA